MKLIQKAKDIVTSKAVHEVSLSLTSDYYDAINGDIMAIARIIYTLASGAMTLSENIFWGKFESFLNGADMSEDELATFCKILSEDGTKQENITRVIDTIDKIDIQSKALFLANASRCLSAKMIDRPLYFRFCHILKNSLYEDLLFLRENVLSGKDFPYDDTIQGLLNIGLMYQRNDEAYAFTPLAKDFDKYVVSYNNDARYPMVLEGKIVKEPRQLHIESGIPIVEF